MQPLLSFRAAFVAKLNLIVKAYGTKAKAIRKLAVPARTFFNWLADDDQANPQRRWATRVDEVYLIAVQKLNGRRKSQAKYRASRKQTLVPCGNCNKLIPEGQTWCPHCGANDEDE